MCGFEGASVEESAASCIPLDGCGRGFLGDVCLIAYLVVIWLVMLNLLVFYIVLFFSQSKDEAEDPNAPQNVLTSKQQSEFYETWTMYVCVCVGSVCCSVALHAYPRPPSRVEHVDSLSSPCSPCSLPHLSYDPLCTGHIRPHELDLFFGSLPRPLGFRPDAVMMNKSLLSELASAAGNDDAESHLQQATSMGHSLEERYCLIPRDEIHRRVMGMEWPVRNGKRRPMREASNGSGLRVSIEDVNIVISKLALKQKEDLKRSLQEE